MKRTTSSILILVLLAIGVVATFSACGNRHMNTDPAKKYGDLQRQSIPKGDPFQPLNQQYETRNHIVILANGMEEGALNFSEETSGSFLIHVKTDLPGLRHELEPINFPSGMKIERTENKEEIEYNLTWKPPRMVPAGQASRTIDNVAIMVVINKDDAQKYEKELSGEPRKIEFKVVVHASTVQPSIDAIEPVRINEGDKKSVTVIVEDHDKTSPQQLKLKIGASAATVVSKLCQQDGSEMAHLESETPTAVPDKPNFYQFTINIDTSKGAPSQLGDDCKTEAPSDSFSAAVKLTAVNGSGARSEEVILPISVQYSEKGARILAPDKEFQVGKADKALFTVSSAHGKVELDQAELRRQLSALSVKPAPTLNCKAPTSPKKLECEIGWTPACSANQRLSVTIQAASVAAGQRTPIQQKIDLIPVPLKSGTCGSPSKAPVNPGQKRTAKQDTIYLGARA